MGMVFLTEMGDLNRFANRRQFGAYLGLAPATFKSGERSGRRGRITRQGTFPATTCPVSGGVGGVMRCSDKW